MKLNKDGLLLRELIKREDIELLNYVPNISCNEKMKDYITFKVNGIDSKRIKSIDTIEEINEDDIYIAWYYYSSHMDLMKDLNCKKVVMGQHFIRLSYNTNFSKMNIDYFVNQINVQNNQFVNYFFDLKNVNCIALPYSYETRFKNQKNFEDRKNKAMSVGTIATLMGKGYDTYLEFFDTACCQPMRKKIYDVGNNEFIDVYNTYIFTTGYNNGIKPNMSLLQYIRQKKEEKCERTQGKYFSYNIVDKYNEYKMCVCAEELVGLPGIGFVESMACGCAYIGIDHDMYRSLGLIPGEHYISYDGTYEDLIRKIEYYQNNESKLSQIAIKGREFVLEKFAEKKVMDDFITTILQ